MTPSTALLANGKINVPATKVAGCLIDRAEPKPVVQSNGPRIRAAAPEVATLLAAREKEHPIDVGKVSYAADVAEIIQNKCQTCHRPGQVGPFSLLTYDDARKHSAMIGEVVENRRMPPWHADPRYGHFVNDRSLSARERATLMAWVDQGAPLGDPKQLPAPRTFSEGWTIGKPDVVFELPETYYVPAQGVVSYVYFRVPTNFKEDMWVQAAEAVPGDRSVVHHIIVYVNDPKAARGPGGRPQTMHFTGYAPGDAPSVFPEGTAKRIPAGADLLFQVHYTPIGKVKTDRSKLGLVFSKTKPTREAFTIGIANADLLIPARTDNVLVSFFMDLTEQRPARELVSAHAPPRQGLQVHDHQAGRISRRSCSRCRPMISAGRPITSSSEPMILPKGTRIDCLAHFDNSESNPYNPDPNKMVRWGEQTFEEMMIGYLDMDVPVGEPIPNGTRLRFHRREGHDGDVPGAAQVCRGRASEGPGPSHAWTRLSEASRNETLRAGSCVVAASLAIATTLCLSRDRGGG